MPRSSHTVVRRSAVASRALFEAVEQRKLFALVGPDLVATGMSLSASDPMPGSGTVDVNFSIKNDGGLWGNAGAFWVTFWHCDGDPRSGPISYSRIDDYRIDKLDSGKTFNGTATIPVQSAGDDNEAWVLMEIDTTKAQGEWDENNNFRTGEGKDFVPFSIEGDLYRNPSYGSPTRGRELTMNGTLDGTIGDEKIGPEDYDLFTTNVTQGRRYMVDLDNVSGSGLNSYVRVYDQHWNLVAGNDNGRDEGEAASTDAYVEFTAQYSGTYHYVVSNAFNRTSDPRVLEGRTWSNQTGSLGGYRISTHTIADRPIVNLSVIDGTATEGSLTDAAIIRVTRSGSPDKELFVAWTPDGEAVGVDYSLPGGSYSGGVNIPAGQQYVDVRITAPDDGTWETTEAAKFTLAGHSSYQVGVNGSATIGIVNAANDRPTVLSAQDIFTDNSGHRVNFRFDDAVGGSLSTSDFVLVNTDTGATLDSSKLTVTWNDADRIATVRFSGFTGGILPNANYRLTLLSNGVTNGGGLAMSSNASKSFFSLAGDVNRDRVVNFSDLVALAQNYNRTGHQLAGGNANGDAAGKVDFSDLVILAQNYNKSLPPLQLPMMAATSPFGDTMIRSARSHVEDRGQYSAFV